MCIVSNTHKQVIKSKGVADGNIFILKTTYFKKTWYVTISGTLLCYNCSQ